MKKYHKIFAQNIQSLQSFSLGTTFYDLFQLTEISKN